MERTRELAEQSNHLILQKRKWGPERGTAFLRVTQRDNPSLPTQGSTCSSAPPACTPLPPSIFNDAWIPSQEPSQRSPCKYFPFGLQVSEIPFLPRGFRQFTLPFSKQIFILIKAFITIIHLSLQGIRQLQSTDWLSRHKPSPPHPTHAFSRGRGTHKQNISLKKERERETNL